VMTVPLAALALLTAVAGFALGLPSEENNITRLLGPVFEPHEAGHSLIVMGLSIIVFTAGLALAYYMYKLTPVRAEAIGQPRTWLHALLLNAWYVDRIYDRLIVQPLYALSVVLARVFDLGVIDGIVNGVARMVAAWGGGLRRLQSGYVANYALTMLAGAVIVVVFLLAR